MWTPARALVWVWPRRAGRAAIGLVEQTATPLGDGPFRLFPFVYESVRLGGEHEDVDVVLAELSLLCERAGGEGVGTFEDP